MRLELQGLKRVLSQSHVFNLWIVRFVRIAVHDDVRAFDWAVLRQELIFLSHPLFPERLGLLTISLEPSRQPQLTRTLDPNSIGELVAPGIANC